MSCEDRTDRTDCDYSPTFEGRGSGENWDKCFLETYALIDALAERVDEEGNLHPKCFVTYPGGENGVERFDQVTFSLAQSLIVRLQELYPVTHLRLGGQIFEWCHYDESHRKFQCDGLGEALDFLISGLEREGYFD